MKQLVLSTLIVCLLITNRTLAQSRDYYGAEIRTYESFLYGKFEVKMKSVETSGMLSSFFLFYDKPDFVTNWNEIDIEILGRYNNEVQFNTITPGNGKRAPHEKRYVLNFNPHEDFHLYGIVWAPDYIAFEVDGEEVYRDSGEHIKEMNKPQKIMMNIWSTIWTEWTGEWKGENLPVAAEYDFVKYYAYNKKEGSFTFKWEEDFESMNGSRWQFATHTFEGNLVRFRPENGVFKDGKLQLVLSNAESKSTEAKKPVVPVDIQLMESSFSKNKIRLKFNTKLDKTTATELVTYKVEGVTIKKVKFVTDYSFEGQEIVLVTNEDLSEKKELSIEISGLKDNSKKDTFNQKIKVVAER